MNECIHQRELTMTVICEMCKNQYGAWRAHCPVCCTATPAVKREIARKVKRESQTQCTFCRLRGAKQRCPHCNELIHGTCLGLHKPGCKQFQTERDAAITRLSQGERS